MAKRGNGRVYECVVVDVNTQRDYCAPDGVSRVANLQMMTPALRHMIAWVRRNYTPLISSIESHRTSELTYDGHPPCCIEGTPGQKKLDFTLLRHRTLIQADSTLCCPLDLFNRFQQVVLRKFSEDFLANPKADRLLTQLPAREYILFGVSLEGSIKALALGLLAREKPVTVVVDACGYWIRGTADLAVRQIEAKGARLITVEELLKRRLQRRWRYPGKRQLAALAEKLLRSESEARNNGAARKNPLRPRLRKSDSEPTIAESNGRSGRKQAE